MVNCLLINSLFETGSYHNRLITSSMFQNFKNRSNAKRKKAVCAWNKFEAPPPKRRQVLHHLLRQHF